AGGGADEPAPHALHRSLAGLRAEDRHAGTQSPAGDLRTAAEPGEPAAGLPFRAALRASHGTVRYASPPSDPGLTRPALRLLASGTGARTMPLNPIESVTPDDVLMQAHD